MVLYKIFLELQKAYNTLNRDRCLDILTGYGMDPGAIRLLQMYWGRIIMVVKARRYCDPPFKGF